MVLYPTLINTSCLVRNLTLSLLRWYIIIYIDNYFTLVALFLELRAYKFSIVGTTLTFFKSIYILPIEIKSLRYRTSIL